MHIEMDEAAKKWIEAKGNHLTVKLLEVNGCCSPDITGITAIPGKPKQKELTHYNELKVDNLSIFVQKMFCKKEKLILKLSGISFLKSVSATLE